MTADEPRPEAETPDLNDQMRVRRDKMEHMRAEGREPYPARSHRTHTCREVLERREELEEAGTEITLVGRITARRAMGKLAFLDVRDESGKFQLFLRKGKAPEAFAAVDDTDLGDFVQATGTATVTKTGEPSLDVDSMHVLAKALRPLPAEGKNEFTDTEERQRRRYVDLAVNPEVRELFRRRARFTRTLCRDLEERWGFLPVETPVLEHVPGGADARPFITHHNTLDVDMFLRISLELHLKRLIVGGYERVYEIGRVFRNEGMSREHLQEFTLLEFYWAYQDYLGLMDMVEEWYAHAIEDTFGTLEIEHRESGETLDFTPPWPRRDYGELLEEHADVRLEDHAEFDSLAAAAEPHGVEIEPGMSRARLVDSLYKRTVRPRLIQPCFLVDHPVEISPLAKRHRSKPGRTERFQVLFAGTEVGNAFSELNDPVDQRARLEEQQALRAAGDEEAQRLDEDFLEALEYGMPPTAGFGVGIDRFFAILAGAPSIREVVFFPTMRPR